VEGDELRDRVLGLLVGRHAGADEAVEPLVAEVRLGRLLAARRLVLDLVGDERGRRVLGEERADDALALLVVALAEVDVAKPAAPVDEVLRRPVPVLERLPGAELVVERDRVLDPVVADGAADVVLLPLECELRRVHSDDHEAVVAVLVVPRADMRECPEAVDARVRPEVEEDDLSSQSGHRERP
jgi:hypothetical protein